jgi:hypothetical protein
MSFLVRVRLYICISALFLFFAPSLLPQESHPKPTTVVVEKVGGRVTYKVDSRQVDDLLRALNQVADRSGPNQPVNVIVDSRLPSAQIWNVDGVAGKAQLANLQFFVFFHETDMMSEIPFSKAPRTRRQIRCAGVPATGAK